MKTHIMIFHISILHQHALAGQQPPDDWQDEI